ncbi:putative bifunctional diguanylate cyclase/phosphodiesterase [Aestuariirhabdus sp. LZHN29]|uniref:putative bifunctional diguanylate cyclase/phosphodiesterase n=1 Tax=Aestuariirhabdus sp. LZHN29 TaxID=3417462 RepID=UPI003CF02C1A
MIDAIRRLLPRVGSNATPDNSNARQRTADVTLYQLQQLHQLHRALPWLVASGALLATAFFWQSLNAYSVLLGWAWLALLMLGRYNLALRFRYRKETGVGHWQLLSCLPALLGGGTVALMMVGLMPITTLALSGVSYLLLLAALLSAMLYYGIFPPAFLCFATASVLPLAVEIMWQNSGYSQLAALGLLLSLALISYGNLCVNRHLLRHHKLAQHSERLQIKLQQTQKELTRSHRQALKSVPLNTPVTPPSISAEKTSRFNNQLRRARKATQLAEQRLSMALDACELSLWEWDLSHDRFVQPQAMEMLGQRYDGHQGFIESLKGLVDEADLLRLKEAMQHYLNGNSLEYRVQFRAHHINGQWLWLEDAGRASAWDPQGRITRIAGTRRNITLEKKQQAESVMFHRLSTLSTQAVCLLDHQFRFLLVNPSFCELTGFSSDELLGRKIGQVSRHHDALFYQEIADQLQRKGFWSGEILEYRKDGSAYPVAANFSSVTDPDGLNPYCLGIYSDLSDLQQTEKRLHFLASFDNLTGLANRELFLRRLSKATATGKPLNLLLFNIDRFKQINESLGHDVGDQLLVQFSRRLRKSARDAELIARTGSDEFAILLPGATGLGSLMQITERLLRKTGRDYRVGSHDLTLTLSAGICRFPQQTRSSRALLQGASRALIEAKKYAGNHYHLYTDELAGKDTKLPLLEGALRKAVTNNEFEVYYQPKLHLASGSIRGVEALVRWQHPQLGLIEPERFIYLAEENGLINAIGEQVLEQACRQARQWLDDGVGEIRVAVNLSAQQLRQGDGFEVVERTLKRTGLPHHLLEMELTESILLEENARVSNSIHRIRDLGVGISIDDFGTGYASLSYLRRFPVNSLKIDRSFISGIPDSENDCAITRAIIAMATSLDLRVVAEGVELPQHAEFLRRFGCDEIQGYLVSKPVPAEKLTELLVSRDPVTL